MKKIILLFIALGSFAEVCAQELRMPKYRFMDNVSLSLGTGANMIFSDKYKEISNRNWGPNAVVSINKDCTPVLGTRVQFGWSKMAINNYTNQIWYEPSKSFLKKWKAFPNSFNTSLDFMFNPLNLFDYNYNRTINVLAIFGVGYTHVFKGTTVSEIVNNYYKKQNFIVPKIGLQVNIKISEPINIFVESDFSVYNDKLDRIVNKAQYDGNMRLFGGITYRFKNHDKTRGFNYVKSYDQKDIDALNAEINKLKERSLSNIETHIDTVKVESISYVKQLAQTAISFRINSAIIEDAQMANIENIVAYMKENKDVRISITGYADAKTGTSEYNQKLSKERAEAVKNVLLKYGIEPIRLLVKAEGDKKQVYEKNNWNRVAIIMELSQY